MADPLGFISGSGGAGINPATRSHHPRAADQGGPNFKSVLIDHLNEVNKAQQDATQAIENLTVGKAELEDVILATQKADTAFKMLQALRNKVVDAYDELKQVRV